MKTLDEILEAMTNEICLNSKADCWEVPVDLYGVILHYLHEYRTLQNGYIKAMADLEDNVALSWDELKQMRGKPIWVDYADDEQQTGWALIVKNPERPTFGKPTLFTLVRDGGKFYLTISGYGKTWQAYRKERK